MKRVLVTAGTVYGVLDANKLVGNRVRGIWATYFADYLGERGYPVTLLTPDVNPPGPVTSSNVTRVTQRGYHDYAAKCEELAADHDAAVMAAAVVNWIPASPYAGKMPTDGYDAGDVIQVPFVLAPRVIDRMRAVNPNLTLVGCKMLVDAGHDALVDAAYHVLTRARCAVVVANDMGRGLRAKHLVYPDRTVRTHDDDWTPFYEELRAVIDDEHFRTRPTPGDNATIVSRDVNDVARATFDRVVAKYRDRFTPRGGGDRVFGSVLVPLMLGGYLASPREKGVAFTSADAVYVADIGVGSRSVYAGRGAKATLNAPLMMLWAEHVRRQAQVDSFFSAFPPVVLHLHEQLPGVPTLPYAPPGTVRDSLRALPEGVRAFNIEGHGFVAALHPFTLDVTP